MTMTGDREMRVCYVMT